MPTAALNAVVEAVDSMVSDVGALSTALGVTVAAVTPGAVATGQSVLLAVAPPPPPSQPPPPMPPAAPPARCLDDPSCAPPLPEPAGRGRGPWARAAASVAAAGGRPARPSAAECFS